MIPVMAYWEKPDTHEEEMTRINVVPPSELHDKHLLAEYRELPRVFALAKPVDDAPKEYVLGAGHVRFFYDKLPFLIRRHYLIVKEMKRRSFKVSFPEPPECAFNNLARLYNHYEPTADAINLNRSRINQRLQEMK